MNNTNTIRVGNNMSDDKRDSAKIKKGWEDLKREKKRIDELKGRLKQREKSIEKAIENIHRERRQISEEKARIADEKNRIDEERELWEQKIARRIHKDFYKERQREFGAKWRDEIKREARRELMDRRERVEADILTKEHKISMWMRMAVIVTFSLIGPILLFIVAAGLLTDPILVTTTLDVFKIWLGAAIGISTNLLQRREQAPVKTPAATTE